MITSSRSGGAAIRIGCASAFWGDTNTAAAQLVRKGEIHYLVFDYLAEVTMSIMAAKRFKDPDDGFATDFVSHVMAPLMSEIKAAGIKVIANAGGVNPLACKKALEAVAAEAGVDLKIAVVLGDDLMMRQAEFASCTEIDSGEPMPKMVVSFNAYLGAVPIARALDAGADIVITGRCIDSALVLGPLMHEFGWNDTDYDRLAAGSIAGHIIECGAQCTGGNFTDWELVKDDFADMGFPIVECTADGSFTVTKPADTGGLVSVHTVLEQMLYEIGDPRAYLLPDVVCDFTEVKLEQLGEHRVKVSGCKGHAPTAFYKASATYPAGARCTAIFMVAGIVAAKKGRASASAIIEKVRRQLFEQNLGDFTGAEVHCIGAEETYGAHARPAASTTREVIVRMVVQHSNMKALKLFAREIAQAATAMSPGFTGQFGMGRPEPHLVPRLFSTLVPKDKLNIEVVLGKRCFPVAVRTQGGFEMPPDVPVLSESIDILDPIEVPLIRLALARSGDKGDHANIGVIARRPEYLPLLRVALTAEAVKQYFTHVLDPVRGAVQRWELPGTTSFNFLLKHALGGGGAASMRTDPQGKCFAQMLLDMPVRVPKALVPD